ncbi:zinc ribbon domain-containing protein [Butyrivibrio sp. JL13D10]|uniref:zinc ribbon domain-containing protein n=1 Tax=Butyrivibrio sp. JL13D10 TaxID=3236815 RepID=UPI0038B52DDF
MLIIYGSRTIIKNYKKDVFLNCPYCGRQGNFRLMKSRRAFTLFFIPTFIRWNYHYYLEDRNCGALFEISKEMGKDIAKGRQIDIWPQQMKLVQVKKPGTAYVYGTANKKICSRCGTQAPSQNIFCTKCGMKFTA